MSRAIDPFEEFLRKKKIELLEQQYRRRHAAEEAGEDGEEPERDSVPPGVEDPEAEERLREEAEEFFNAGKDAAAKLFQEAAVLDEEKVEEIRDALDEVFEEDAPSPQVEAEAETFVSFFQEVSRAYREAPPPAPPQAPPLPAAPLSDLPGTQPGAGKENEVNVPGGACEEPVKQGAVDPATLAEEIAVVLPGDDPAAEGAAKASEAPEAEEGPEGQEAPEPPEVPQAGEVPEAAEVPETAEVQEAAEVPETAEVLRAAGAPEAADGALEEAGTDPVSSLPAGLRGSVECEISPADALSVAGADPAVAEIAAGPLAEAEEEQAAGAGAALPRRLDIAEILLRDLGSITLEQRVEVLCRLVARLAERARLPESDLIEALIRSEVEF